MTSVRSRARKEADKAKVATLSRAAEADCKAAEAERKADEKPTAPSRRPTPARRSRRPARYAREAATREEVYTVKSGDTLSEIAARHGADWHELARVNNIDNPDLIFPGQKIRIPK